MFRKIFGGIILLAALAVLSVSSCRKDPVTPPGDDGNDTGSGMVAMTPYELVYPAHFPEPYAIPEDNKMYLERIQLGKRLFFDTRLSNNGESCNTCHLQDKGFSMDGTSAFDKGLTSLPLINLAWYKNFMWSGRIVGSLEDVMGFELRDRFKTDINKINAIEEYRKMFKDFYGVNEITIDVMTKPLAQYMRALVSKNTRYERSVLGFEQLTTMEQAGMNIFFTEKGDCFHCHVAVIATDNMLHNNGLDTFYNKEIDKGYYNVTKNPDDLGKFRTPNLRNVALRNDFMHDGRFKTLEEVVEFYDHGVHKVANVDPVMLKPAKINGLHLTDAEKKQLVAFLKTLTDPVMITDTLFKNPF